MRNTITLSCLLMLAASSTAFAQAQAVKISQYRAWGTYSHTADTGKICYTLTVPETKQPATLDHGDIFFMVAPQPGEGGLYNLQFVASYPFQEASAPSVTIGDKTYAMVAVGNAAHLANPDEDAEVIAAMKAGANMRVAAKSGRGNDTGYVFSLSGVSAALDAIETCQ